MKFRRFRPLVVLMAALALGLAMGPAVTAQINRAPANQPTPTWPHEKSDLKPEPGVIFGTLPNGMRYAIQKNATPPGQVAMRMLVKAGSMHEGPGQEGVAHLLEHMAFHGSTNIADGEISGMLSNLGLRMGADANAGTSSLFTQYMFNLARGDDQSIDTGLLLLREFAGELVLSPQRLEIERGVVLAEERARGGAAIAMTEAVLKAEVGDHPFSRPTIGSTDVIRTVPIGQLRAFYDAYYRPERTTLVIVGDMDPRAVEAKIKAKFSDWRGRGPAGGDPAPVGTDIPGPPVQMKIVPGSPENGLKLIWRHPYKPHDPSRAFRIRQEIEALGQQAMLLRLRELSEANGQPFLTANPVNASDIPGVSRMSVMDAYFINDLPKAIDVLITAQRQLATQGVTQVELDRAIAARRLALQNRIAEASSRQTLELTDILLSYALSDALILDPKESLALFEEVVKTVKADQVNSVMRARFEGEPTLFYYAAAEPPGGLPAIQQAVARARTAPLAQYAAAALKEWKHTDFGRPGRVVERKTREDVGVTMVRFENGVRLTVKPTDFSDENILVKVRFGYGQLHLPKDELTAADFATTILNGGGLVDMTRSELAATLAGKQVVAIASQEDDAFEWINPLGVPPANLDLQMQLFAANFSRHGYRTDDWAVTIRSGAEADRAAPFDPERLYQRFSPALLHSGDMRWVISTPDQHVKWDPKDAVAWVKPIVETYPLEVVMVGDVTVERAIEATAKTLGALPPRREIPEPSDLRRVNFPKGVADPIEVKHKGRQDQAILSVQWPAADAFANPRDTQTAALLSTILGSRLTSVVRETQGKTYSPDVYDRLSTVLPGYGTIGVEMTLQPQDVPNTLRIIDIIAADLAVRDVPPDEFAAAVAPRVETIARAQRDNRYWFEMLNGVQRDPRRLDMAANAIAITRSLTPADVRNAARRWLVRERSWRMTVTPETRVAETAPSIGIAPYAPVAGPAAR
jgi:zinc protease